MIANDVQLGEGVVIHHPDLVNLYGCQIGPGTKIGSFVEIQKGASVGARCKISSHTFICEGVTIEEGVFVGHGVMFINDRYPRAVAADGHLLTEADWELTATRVKIGAAIGSNNSMWSYDRKRGFGGRRGCRDARCTGLCNSCRRTGADHG
jgi:UDP-2-acetamido-3-amino-2,3-dideoxy-glucuronate N-acetyltransferase